MKKFLVLGLLAMFASSCSFSDEDHNDRTLRNWDRGATEFHELFDFFFLTSK
jgi:hypothetical protein